MTPPKKSLLQSLRVQLFRHTVHQEFAFCEAESYSEWPRLSTTSWPYEWPQIHQDNLFGDTAGSGRRHRALDDARMTARIWLKMEEQ